MSQRRFQPLDIAAGGFSIILIVVIAVVILAGTWEGVRVRLTGTDGHGEIGPYGSIVLSFSDSVNQAAVEALFSIQPNISGHMKWADSKTLQFIPLKPLQPDVDYRVSLEKGPLGSPGLFLRKRYSQTIQVRKSQIVYKALINHKTQLWIMDTAGKSARQLGKFEKSIFNFDAAPNGEYVIFSALNDKQGIDLWQLDRSGTSLRLLLNCGADRCTTPVISPDSKQVAYTREGAPLTPSAPTGAPRIRIVNVESGEDRPLYADPQIIGYGPGWSPDGKYITSYDGIQQLIRVVAVQSGEQFNLPSATGDMPSWSPDSKTILFTDFAQVAGKAWTQVKMANVDTGEISILMGKNDDQDNQYGELAWSPTSQDIVIGMRVTPGSPSRGLLLTQSEALDGPMFANDPNYIFGTPKWDMWGTQLVFDQEEKKGEHNSEIKLWSMRLAQPLLLAQGTSPHWLP